MGLAAVSLATETGRDPDPAQAVGADLERVEAYLRELGDLTGENGRWDMSFEGVALTILTDEAANRMRIIASIEKADGLASEQLRAMLEANFDRTLDAKYAIWNGMVWASYTHPLEGIRQREVESGVRQVAELHRTYGSTYSTIDPFPGPFDAH